MNMPVTACLLTLALVSGAAAKEPPRTAEPKPWTMPFTIQTVAPGKGSAENITVLHKESIYSPNWFWLTEKITPPCGDK